MSKVADFYTDRGVFLTGGTGFLGVSLIEKLLRSCTGVKNIYLLMRPKKGKQAAERLEELTKNSVFDRLREENKTELFEKLIAVAGDVGQDNLGISPADRETLKENAQIVFHCAATLDFEADLLSTFNINLMGTRRVLNLCHEIKDLKALVHVSSAYVNATLQNVQEQVYPTPCADVNELEAKLAKMDEAEAKKAENEILKGHTNCYTFTKHLAEHEVMNARLPAAIVRPSMITGAWKEPMPGWTISKNGPQGFLMGAAKGVVRRVPSKPDLIYDYIPLDIVVNTLIAAAYKVDCDGDKELKVYHCTSSTTNPFKWKMVQDKINPYLHKFPLKSAVWYPYLKLSPSVFWFRISAFFVHMLPAYGLDAVTKICGGRPILVRMHTNVNRSLKRLETFIVNEWRFHNPRLLHLQECLSPEDQELFNLDIKSLVWEDYFLELTMGVRTYLHKEPRESLEKARAKDKVLQIAHICLQVGVLGLIWALMKCVLGITWTKSVLILPMIYLMYAQL